MEGVTGLDEVLRKLRKIPERIQKNVVVGAVRAGTKPIVKEAKALVPTNTGILKKSIGVAKRKSKDKNIIHFSVAPRSKAVHKALLKNKQGKWLISKVTGRRYLNVENYGGHVEFGRNGGAAHPFMRPAFEKKGEESIDFVREYMKKRVDKEIAKL